MIFSAKGVPAAAPTSRRKPPRQKKKPKNNTKRTHRFDASFLSARKYVSLRGGLCPTWQSVSHMHRTEESGLPRRFHRLAMTENLKSSCRGDHRSPVLCVHRPKLAGDRKGRPYGHAGTFPQKRTGQNTSGDDDRQGRCALAARAPGKKGPLQ